MTQHVATFPAHGTTLAKMEEDAARSAQRLCGDEYEVERITYTALETSEYELVSSDGGFVQTIISLWNCEVRAYYRPVTSGVQWVDEEPADRV